MILKTYAVFVTIVAILIGIAEHLGNNELEALKQKKIEARKPIVMLVQYSNGTVERPFVIESSTALDFNFSPSNNTNVVIIGIRIVN